MWLLDALYKYRDSKKTAVIHNDEKTSFGELWKESEAVAGFLKSQHLADNKTPVVIYGNKETDIIAVMHGALKSGLAYVPVDTSYPLERLEKIMDQVGAQVLFNFSDIEVTRDGCQVVTAEQLNEIYEEYKDFLSNAQDWVADDDICYILFTSGSTGEPKGVPIRKRNIVNFVEWTKQFAVDGVNCTEQPRALNQVSYSFDVSVFALYLYLSEGIAIFSLDKYTVADPQRLYAQLASSHISFWVSTPAFAEICCMEDTFNKKLLPALRKCIVAGEVLTKKLVKKLWFRFPDLQIYNGYGPTECTVLLSACKIDEEMLESEEALPIGYLLPDAHYELLNTSVIEGKNAGELAVVSRSVGGEYFRNLQKTKEKFWLDSRTGNYGYKTGDLVYIQKNLLYYIGRIDSQIKLHGYRIELDDISQNLDKLDYVRNSVVLPVKIANTVDYLAAFIKLRGTLHVSKLKMMIKVKKDLGLMIPSYMVPKKVIFVDEFPLNVNGKIDRKKLMERL